LFNFGTASLVIVFNEVPVIHQYIVNREKHLNNLITINTS
jgi:hypothetical protein